MEEIIHAWQIAAEELNIKVYSPFSFLDEEGLRFQFELVIENFGSKKGTIVLSMNEVNDTSIPERLGVFCSQVNLEIYGKYDREEFIDTLIDWGYFGPEEDKPAWYPGNPIKID